MTGRCLGAGEIHRDVHPAVPVDTVLEYMHDPHALVNPQGSTLSKTARRVRNQTVYRAES